jgi:DNA-binding LacI/PurR family transcriptional regulator
LVSKVLSDKLTTTRVSPDTVRKVRQAAERMGYRKNMSAVALLAGRHDVVGVFIHSLGMVGSGIIEDLLAGICAQSRQSHQSLMLNFFENAADFETRSEVAHSGRMDGLLVGGCFDAGHRDRLLAIRKAGLPVVTIYDEALDPSVPNVGLDQVLVSRLATEHLIQRGSRRIAHIATMPTRLTGYRQALQKAGLACDPALVYHTDVDYFGRIEGERAVQAFLARGVPIDGIVAQSDHEAVGCINALCAAGRRVPEDVRVIGVDNAPFCELARVPLSSVAQQFKLRGDTAMRMLMDMVDGQDVASSRVTPIVVERESTR